MLDSDSEPWTLQVHEDESSMRDIEHYIHGFSSDAELTRNVRATVERVQQAVLGDGVREVVAAFSGGKDSTALLILLAETIARGLQTHARIRVVFADTKLEIPALTDAAFAVLGRFREYCDEHGVEYIIHLTERPLEHSFWVLLIGKGYPPPNRYFRWCTDRLKIQPPRTILRSLTERAALFTGVRADESQARARTLGNNCSVDGECGIERWTDAENQEGLRFYAPLIDWRTCKVWDFLSLWAYEAGWPVRGLTETYGTGATRFGCWTCTLIEEDKALAQVTQLEEWEHLKPLAEFRKRLQTDSKMPSNRLYRSSGAKGKLTLSFRKALLNDLLALQDKVGRQLISLQEVELIRELWQDELPRVYTELTEASRSEKA